MTNEEAVYVETLTSSAPAGVTATLDYSALEALQPGESQSVPLDVTTATGIALGKYVVTVSLTGADDSGAALQASVTATVTVSGQSFASPVVLLTDCRRLFPALVDVPRLFYVSGDGQTASPGSALPFPLMAATWFGSVRFTILEGNGTLSNPNMTPSSATGTGGYLDVTPGSGPPGSTSTAALDGIAWCTWTIDSTPAQLVRADLLDVDGNVTGGPPLYYTVVLPGQQAQQPQSNGNTGLLELSVNNTMVVKNPYIFGPFKHSLSVSVPPAMTWGTSAT